MRVVRLIVLRFDSFEESERRLVVGVLRHEFPTEGFGERSERYQFGLGHELASLGRRKRLSRGVEFGL